MTQNNFSCTFLSKNIKYSFLSLALLSAVAFPSFSMAQDAIPDAPVEADPFGFDDAGLDFEKTPEDLEDSFRGEAFDKALKTLLPLKPEEIRTLLEHFDRTVESTQLPVHPYPRPELVVQNISLDPGVAPLTVKLAYGYVTTLSIVDSSGEPWPIEDISWVGDFKIHESMVTDTTNILRVSPETKFAHGNISMRLVGLNAPVIMTFETNRDIVHYRFDAVVPKRGPTAKTPLIERGIELTSGDPDMSVALSGVVPGDADILNVSGVDGRTSAYVYNGLTYIRTPLTLLSPGWDSSVTSADGTKIYALEETPVVLLSDKGRMVRAYLSEREDLLDE
tara:strand:- start:635 stop:1639 length:1005 start_codon:yes stop_codon:yes gene_type:complete